MKLSLPDLYDTDIIKLEAVLVTLNERKTKTIDLEAFRKEAIERFGEAGFEVEVKVWYTDELGTYAFDIEVVGKLDKRTPFDHERMHHEVTHDVLDLGEGGTIDANGVLREKR